jgi:mono/diheme cytochrome c family protein
MIPPRLPIRRRYRVEPGAAGLGTDAIDREAPQPPGVTARDPRRIGLVRHRRGRTEPGRVRRQLVRCAILAVVGLSACASPDTSDPITRGREVYGRICSACHGAGGEGGVGPSLRTVLDTWPDCADQIEWVTIGSEGWTAAHGPTYGATGKPVKGGMPAHRALLEPDEIAAVSAFERVRYGGADEAATLAGCGIGAASSAGS